MSNISDIFCSHPHACTHAAALFRRPFNITTRPCALPRTELEAGVYAGLVLATAEETFGRQSQRERSTDLGPNAGPLTRHKKHLAVTSTSSSKSTKKQNQLENSTLDDDIDGVALGKKKDFLFYAKRVGDGGDALFPVSSSSMSPSSQSSPLYPLSGSGSTTHTQSTSSVSSRSAGSFSTRTPREVREVIYLVPGSGGMFLPFCIVYFCEGRRRRPLVDTLVISDLVLIPV